MLDTAVSRALLERVAAGELPDTLRLARPGRMVPFGKQDAVARGYVDAVRAAREQGYEAVLRMAGGRAAVFHEDTLELAHASSEADAMGTIHPRFRDTAELLAAAVRRLGVDGGVGEVPGEYCPGGYSVNAGRRTKLGGVGQRLIRGGAHVGAVLVASGEERIREVLVPVYSALGLEWDPSTAGSAGSSFEHLLAAVRAEYEERYALEEAALDDETLALARRLAPEHRPASV